MMAPAAPAGRAPVSPRSRFFRRPDRPYTEVDGRPVVIHPDRRTFYELTPAATAVWASLDGRSVRELATSITTSTGSDPVLSCVELVRRWRALGLIEECTVLGTAPADDLHLPSPPKTEIALVADTAATGAVLVVGLGARSTVTVVVTPPRLAGAAVALRGLVQLGPIPGSGSMAQPAEAEAEGPLSPLAVFGALVQSVADEELHDGGLADALASLAESLAGLRLPATDLDSTEVQHAIDELLHE